MTKPTIHLICNAHLDPVWQWRWEEGCSEALSTFRNAVQLLHENDELIFNHNEAILYQWVQKYDPALFREIQSLVSKGRWFISGGWFLQPDMNIPGTESIIRQIIKGRVYFKEYFNAEPQVAYNFDSFGHTGGLPQILKLAGYKMYIHMRPHQAELPIPSDLYIWKGIDGTEIPAYRISVGLYHTEFNNIKQRLKEGVEFALKQKRDIGLFWGIGNHGGGATRKDLEIIKQFAEKEKRVDFIHSTTDRLFESLKPYMPSAPVVEGDLQRIFTGCYTSISRVKRAAQKSLARIVQAETLSTAAWWLYGKDYPESELEEIWKDHLFNDFHDILPGSCTEPAEQDALKLYGRAEESARRLNLASAVCFAQQKPFENAYLPVTILNTNSAFTNVPVEFECMFDYRPAWEGEWHLHLYKPDGTEIECQEEQPEALLPFHDWRRKICFYAELPALGAADYRLKPVEEKINLNEIDPAIKFKLNPKTGFVDELFCNNKQSLADSLLKPLIVEDTGDSWGTDLWNYRKIAGEFQFVKDSYKVIQKGPVRTITESIFELNKSRLVYQTIAYSRFPVIEYRIRIHWNEERKRLKLSVPTIFKAGGILCEVPGGSIMRPADGEEHVHGRWFIAEQNDFALAVINNGQHGIDFHNGEARLSVLRSAAYCHEQGKVLEAYPFRKYMDQGVHDIQLMVTTGNPDYLKNTVSALADFMNMPPLAYAHLPIGSIDNKVAKQTEIKDLLNIDKNNIRLLAFYKLDNKDALTVRLQETSGKETDCIFKLSYPVTEIKLTFKAYEIKTLEIDKIGNWRETELC